MWRSRGWDGEFSPKRILGRLNLLFNRKHRYPLEHGRAVVSAIVNRDADLVVFSGDATTAALKGEFEDVVKLFTPIREKWGDRFVAIPGNHDRYTKGVSQGRAFEKYIVGKEQTYPYVLNLGDGYSLIAIDLSWPRPVSAKGRMTQAQFEAIRKRIEAEKLKGRKCLVVGHYPLAYPYGQKIRPGHVLPKRNMLAEMLEKAEVRLYMHGHIHKRWAINVQTRGPLQEVRPWKNDSWGLLCVNSGSAGKRSEHAGHTAGYGEIVLEDDGLASITAHYLDGTDRSSAQWKSYSLQTGPPVL